VWKLWYFLAVWAACIVSLGALIPRWPAVVVALALAIWKIWRPNVWIHNATEVLVYSGIALLIVPIFNLIWVTALLLLVSAYDAYAVWRSRHMVAMAQFQTDSKLFAGLFVPYERGTKMQRETSMKVRAVRKPAKEAPRESRNAILGGGDIAFPMLFAGVVLDELLQRGLSKVAAFGYSFIVVVVAAAALLLLFTYAKKDRFYPAMPFLTAGCLVGYGIMWLFL
jgi:presenilin-like A22 family membrane protease